MVTTNPAMLTGYLFKRSHGNAFKKWNRRWFTLVNSKLYYQKRNEYNGASQMEQDLRVCKVREVNDNERRFTFEIVTPKCRHYLQADSQQECTFWVQYIDKAINDALNNTIGLMSNSYGSVEIPISQEDSDSSEYNPESVDSNDINLLNDSISSNSMSKNVSIRSIKEIPEVIPDELDNKNSLILSVKGNQ